MSVLIASDLDRTLIYSATARRLGDDDVPCRGVELHDGESVAFMTEAAAGLLAGLAALSAVAAVVPVTTRILEQYRRVRLPLATPAAVSRYAVTTNGAMLLVDGVPDRAWSERIDRELRDCVPLDEVWDHVARVCHAEFTVALRNADDRFCYAVVRRPRLPPGFVDEVTAWARERGWRTSLQGHKLYWVPEGITKSAAVAEVAHRVGAELVLAAGDSLLDIDLLLAAHRGIHPGHGELAELGWSAPSVVRTRSRGIGAGEEILQWFTDQVARHAGTPTG